MLCLHISMLQLCHHPADSVTSFVRGLNSLSSIFIVFSYLGTDLLQLVKEFKYLGHRITDNLTDDADIRNRFVRTNILRRRFYKIMFYGCEMYFVKTCCICLYDTALWSITGCAVAQHCCNDDQQSRWENGDFDPCRSETPENFITKIGYIDYIAGGNTHA